jgi:hypothetical protein
VITARDAVAVAEEQDRRHLLAFIFGIMALAVAAFFTNIFGPWLYVWIYVGAMMRIAVQVLESAPASVPQEIDTPIVPVTIRPAMTRRYR